MTREQAIGNLKYAKHWKDRPTDEALDMAIKALEQTPCDVCKYNPPSSGDGKPCTMCPAGK